MSKTVADRVIAVIARVRKIPPEEISLDVTFEQLSIDSLGIIDLLFELEEEFDIEIPDDEAMRMENVGEVVSSLEEFLAAKEQEAEG
jgi:acyl carrier protein